MLTNDELMALLRQSKGGTLLDFGRAVDAAAVKRLSEHGPVCGENRGPMDADLVGCGKPIAEQDQVYRCTHCAVPFHRDCAERHFANTPELSARAMDEQIRRIDASDARVEPAEPSSSDPLSQNKPAASSESSVSEIVGGLFGECVVRSAVEPGEQQ